jgi:hypothetical protein
MTDAKDALIAAAARLLHVPGVNGRRQLHGSNVGRVAALLREVLADLDVEEQAAETTWNDVLTWLDEQLLHLGVEPAARTLSCARDKMQAYMAEHDVKLVDLALGTYRGGRYFERWQQAKWQSIGESIHGGVPLESRAAAVRLFTVPSPRQTVVLYQVGHPS